MGDISDLKYYKYYLIGIITKDNKKEINRQTRQIDKRIKELLNESQPSRA